MQQLFPEKLHNGATACQFPIQISFSRFYFYFQCIQIWNSGYWIANLHEYKYCPWLLLDERGYFTNSKLFFETEMYFCLLLLHKFRLLIFIKSQLFFFIFLKTSSAEESEQMDNLTQGFLLCVKPFWMKWNDTVSFEHIYIYIYQKRSKNVEAYKKMFPFTFKTVRWSSCWKHLEITFLSDQPLHSHFLPHSHDLQPWLRKKVKFPLFLYDNLHLKTLFFLQKLKIIQMCAK